MNLEAKLKELEDKLFNSEWKPLFGRDWPVIPRKKYHRTEEHHISNENFEFVNKELSKLHGNAVTEFLKLFGSLPEHPSPLKNIDKGKLLLFQLLSGSTSKSIPNCPYSTYREIYKTFWRENKDKIQQWCDSWVSILSTPEIRLLYASIHNSEPFKGVTMLIDGKDFITHLNNLDDELKRTENGVRTTISRKLNWKNGGKIVFLDDIKMNPIMISRMCGANEQYDGHVMTEMKIYRVMEPKIDCLIYDHAFDSDARYMLTLKECIDKGITRRNLCPNIGKKANVPLTQDEQAYKDKHGSFRSIQETERNATLVNTFRIFSIHSSRKVFKYDEFVLQTVVACILLAISRECKRNNYNEVDSMWADKEFDYPTTEPPISSDSVLELLSQGQALREMQQKEIEKLFQINVFDNPSNGNNNIDNVEAIPLVPACSRWDPNVSEYKPKSRVRGCKKSKSSVASPSSSMITSSNKLIIDNVQNPQLKKRKRKEEDNNNTKKMKEIKIKTSNVDIYKRKFRNNTRGNWKQRNSDKILNKQKKNQEII